MFNHILRFVKQDEGASAAEYALLVGLLTVGIVAAVGSLSGAITSALNTAAGLISGS